MRKILDTGVFLFSLLLATPLLATFYLVPDDAALIQRADSIVLAAPLSVHGELNGAGGVSTVVELRVESVLKGSEKPGDTLRLHEPGGAVGEIRTIIFDTPTYQVGQRYLIFTDFDADGSPTTLGFALGQFTLTQESGGRTLAIRSGGVNGFNSNLEQYEEPVRDAEAFIAYIHGVLEGRIALEPTYLIPVNDTRRSVVALAERPHVEAASFTMASYLGYSGQNTRWTNPTYTFKTNGAQPPLDAGASASTASTSAANWNVAGTGVHVTVSGTSSSTTGLTGPDGQNVILFNDPANEFPQMAGLAGALGGVNDQGPGYPLPDGSGTAFSPTEVDVVVAKNFAPISCLTTILTHEVGHTLGFRHANKNASEGPCSLPLDCTTDAIMTSNPTCGTNSLRAWDQRADTTVYCVGTPSISADPQNVTIAFGSSTTLSVTASGAISYQWYVGNSGDSSNPISGATGSTVQVSPASTTTYWVLVAGCGGATAPSAAATVTVNCGPSITTQPTGGTINFGQSMQLSVVAGGQPPLTYQWYIGSRGDTSNPINGQTASSITVSPTTTTSYWVRVTGCSGNTADSDTATVTVTCNTASISVQPQNATINVGQSTSLSITATGTSPTYQWYQGDPPSTTTTVPSGTGSSVQVSPTTTTHYWVRVSVACDSSHFDSNAAIVTVTCNTASISAQPQNATIAFGGSTTLSVTAGGSSPTYQWYQGDPPSTTTPVAGGTGSSLQVSPSATTHYWVRVSVACDSSHKDSDAAIVTVICAPSITSQPTGGSITLGQSRQLSVTATGAPPLTYQWYIGTKGDTSNPINGETSSSTTVSPTTTTSYWVRVTGCSGNTADSNTATVNVDCKPVINTQPQSAVITAGNSTILSINATGVTSYQWYIGSSGNTATLAPNGTNSTLTVSPTVTTSYWVRVTNSCGSRDSFTATVTVSTVVCPTVAVTTPTATPTGNNNYTLSVTASGGTSFTYTWFTQTLGGPVQAGTGNPFSVNVPSATVYFVHVQNNCGNSIDSAQITVGGPACTNPTVPTPPSISTTTLSSVTLTVSATSTSGTMHYQWYRGTAPDATTPVGTDSASFTTKITATANFWVKVTNDCGLTNSGTITVTALAGKRRAGKK